MENQDPTVETVARPSGKRVAHCLTCHHEWQPRDGTTEKPARCPECKKRNVKWRDLCTPEELELRKKTPVDDGKPVEIVEEIGVSDPVVERGFISTQEEIDEIKSELKTMKQNGPDSVVTNTDVNLEDAGLGNPEPVTLEKIQEDMKGRINGLPFVILLGVIGAVGLVAFFLRRHKKRRVKTQGQAPHHKEEEGEPAPTGYTPETIAHNQYGNLAPPWYMTQTSGLTPRGGF